MVDSTGLPVCAFLIPEVRDSDRRPHPAISWRVLEEGLVGMFGGLTGPETVILYRATRPILGKWSSGRREGPVEDVSRRYTVAIPAERVEDLRAFLRRAGNSFDQRVIYLEIAGYAELLEAHPEDGQLEV